LLGVEDETSDITSEIETTLRKSGVKEVLLLDQQLSLRVL
jgi:hypothetical protein